MSVLKPDIKKQQETQTPKEMVWHYIIDMLQCKKDDKDHNHPTKESSACSEHILTYILYTRNSCSRHKKCMFLYTEYNVSSEAKGSNWLLF